MDDKNRNNAVPEAELSDVVGGARANTPSWEEMQKSVKTTGVGDALIDAVKNPVGFSPLYALVSFLSSDKPSTK